MGVMTQLLQGRVLRAGAYGIRRQHQSIIVALHVAGAVDQGFGL